MKVCPKCGRLYADTVSSCPACGISLEQTQSQPESAPAAPAGQQKLPWILAIAAALALMFLLGRYTG